MEVSEVGDPEHLQEDEGPRRSPNLQGHQINMAVFPRYPVKSDYRVPETHSHVYCLTVPTIDDRWFQPAETGREDII